MARSCQEVARAAARLVYSLKPGHTPHWLEFPHMKPGRRVIRLRSDLTVERQESGGQTVYTVRDPVSGDDFEFGEEEYFLIERIGTGEPPELIAANFRERFGEPIELRQIDAFVDRLRLWKLIFDDQVEDASSSSHTGLADTELEDDNLLPDEEWELPRAQRFGGDTGTRWQPDRAGVLIRPRHYKALWHEPRWIGWMARAFRPLRYLVYLTPLLLVLAVATLAHQWPLVAADFERLWRPWNLVEHLVFSLFTANLVSKISSGMTCSATGGRVPSFGIHFALGFLPRFHVELAGWDNMERRGILWTLASPMLAKLILFSLGILVWYVARDSGSQLPMIAFVLAAVALLSLLVSGNPFGVGDGYAFMSGLLRQSNLRGKAFRALFGRLLPKRKRLPSGAAGLGLLRLYGLATVTYILLLLWLLFHYLAVWLESRFEGTGVLIFLLLLLTLFSQVFRRVSSRRSRATAATHPTVTQSAELGRRHGPGVSAGGGLKEGPKSSTRREAAIPSRRRTRWGWILFLLALATTFFIPYEYETGGRLEVKARERREIYSESPGIVERVEADGGRWVEAGAVLAAMSSYRESGEVDSLRAQVERQEAQLQKLLTTPRKEEVELAAKQYEAARVRERFAESESKRMEALRKAGNVSETDYDDAMRKHEVAIQETLEYKANLDLITQGPHPQEIEGARAELKRLQAELVREEERLRRTQLVSPISGRLEQLDLVELTGKYLDDGDLYTAIIDDRVLRAEVEIPESDLPMVAIGDRARLKFWAYTDQVFSGEVYDIDPSVEQETIGRVSRVRIRVPNEAALLKTGMTGYGKIAGRSESLALAFTHRLVRFFALEVWSWIP
jgi:putative peptide zinc metalloprotease protein